MRRAQRFLLAGVALSLVASACADRAREPDSVTEIAPGRGVLHPVAHLAHERLGECSGIVHLGGAFWAHNDSGDTPTLYRSADLSFDDAEVLPVSGASAVDWEDITVFRGDLLVCDIGDNARRREVLNLYRVRYTPGGADAAGRAQLVATYPFRYPDGKHDAEACFTIADTIFIVGKDRGEGTGVYRFATLQTTEELDGGVNVPQRVGTLDLETGETVTAGTYDEASQTVVLLTYSAILTYPRDGIDGKPQVVTRTWARQSEAICLCDGKLIFTNEERDVFVVDRFLERGFTELIPPRGSLTLLAQPGGNDLSSGRWKTPATEIPLQGARPGEQVFWILAGDAIHIHGRLEFDGEFEATSGDPPKPGSAVLFLFGRREKRLTSAEETQLALIKDPGVGFATWRVGWLVNETAPVPFPGRTMATAENGILDFTVSLPVAEIFGGRLPDEFRFDLRGMGLHATGDVYFSGEGLYSMQRPYTWGKVVVESHP